MSVREEEGQDTKGSLYFLAGCFGPFGFLSLHFTTVSLNPDSVFEHFLKSTFIILQLPSLGRLSGAKGKSS